MVELVGTLAVFLIEPVRGNAVLGRPVHVARANLDLVKLAARPEDSRVERLIAVRFGARDVVFDPLLQRCPGVVNDAEYVIAVGDRIHEYADREQIVDLLERLAALLHLLEDRPEVLRPADDFPARDPGAPQLIGERRPHPFDRPLALHAPRFDLPRQLFVVLRLEILERQVFELRLDARHAEAVSERSIQLARLQRDALALLRRNGAHRADVWQPIAELHQMYPAY